MNKVKLPRSYKVYLPLAIYFVLLFLLMPRSVEFKYEYRSGSTWKYAPLVAEFDFPLLKTKAELQEARQKAGSGVIPYYTANEELFSENLKLFEELSLGEWEKHRVKIKNILTDIYVRYGVAEELEPSTAEMIKVQIGKTKVKDQPRAEVFSLKDARAYFKSEIGKLDPAMNLDTLCNSTPILQLVQQNLEFDQQTTDLFHDSAVNYISETKETIHAGTLIVSENEPITDEIKQKIDSYKVEYNKNFAYSGTPILLWLGNAALALFLTLLLFFTIFYTNPKVFNDFNRYWYILMISLIFAIATFVINQIDPQKIYLIPYSLMALYFVAFFKMKVVYPVYMISLLPLLLFVHGGVQLFVMYLVAGAVGIFSFRSFNKGWLQFITAAIVCLSLLVTYMAFKLVDGLESIHDYQEVAYICAGSLFTVLGYPLIYLFERVFALVSNVRLTELTDTNNKYLRELAQKAPGTFQHSLQVMNMVDEAARAIGANVTLLRCAALYHDIGKILNPMCFIENQTPGENYHAGMDPTESAKQIIRHVTDGEAIARKANLPQVVIDLITSHHGTTCVAFFYNLYLKAGGDPENAGDFYYKGKRPVTKEQIILMVCDSIEAASRTLKDYTAETISNFVDGIFKAKIADGQFEEAEISLCELNLLKDVLKDYLQQVHHARIDYPKR